MLAEMVEVDQESRSADLAASVAFLVVILQLLDSDPVSVHLNLLYIPSVLSCAEVRPYRLTDSETCR